MKNPLHRILPGILTYAERVARFDKTVRAKGGKLHWYDMPGRGIENEKLGVFVAYFGPKNPVNVLVLDSGLHGIEGLAGDDLQIYFLEEMLDSLMAADPSMGFLLPHLIVPWAVSWLSRTDEQNINVNRNCPDWDNLPDNSEYEKISHVVNDDTIHRTFLSKDQARELMRYINKHGFRKFRILVASGQYENADWMEFGGFGPSETNLLLRKIIRTLFPKCAKRCVWLNTHTGLGKDGYSVITEVPNTHHHHVQRRATRFFGKRKVQSVHDKNDLTMPNSGTIECLLFEEFSELMPHCKLTPVCLEFGTWPYIWLPGIGHQLAVTWAGLGVRADNILRIHHGYNVESDDGQWVKECMLKRFYPLSRKWFRRMLGNGATVIQQSCAGMTAHNEEQET